MMHFRNRYITPPDTFGIRLFRKSFEGFYNWWKEVTNDEYLKHYMGYERENIAKGRLNWSS